MRLDKFISGSTDFSRSQVKKLIRSGEVKVNQATEKNPAVLVEATAVVSLKGAIIALPQKRYFMFNKPPGVVSATKDGEHTTAIDFLDVSRPENLQIAGRLDIDATGLLLITDDGQWNHRVTSPKKECLKRYVVDLASPVKPDEQKLWVEKCGKGIWLDGEKRRTLPAQVSFEGENSVVLIISEGKYHQVKRMCAALGNRVVSLHREAIGSIQLDNQLNQGQYRALTQDEVGSV